MVAISSVGKLVGGLGIAFSYAVRGLDWYIQRGRELKAPKAIPPPPPLPRLAPSRRALIGRRECRMCSEKPFALTKQGKRTCVSQQCTTAEEECRRNWIFSVRRDFSLRTMLSRGWCSCKEDFYYIVVDSNRDLISGPQSTYIGGAL